MRRLEFAAWLCAAMIVASAPMFAAETDSPLSDAQLQQMTQAVCNVPIVKGEHDNHWNCRAARNYPGPPGERCAVRLVRTIDGDYPRRDRVGIYYGEFTAHEPQAIVMYESSCESHATDDGGTALFKLVNNAFTLLRWFPSEVENDCTVPPSPDGELQTAYCFHSHGGQGEMGSVFGPTTFLSDGEVVRYQEWAKAGNVDGQSLPLRQISCEPSPQFHHFISVNYDRAKKQVVLEAAAYDPKTTAKACARMRNGDLNAAERDYRKNGFYMSPDMAFARPEENWLVKAFIRFTPPDGNPRIDITSEAASAN